MDLNTARKKLDIPGYVHPEDNNSSNRNGIYKTFSEGEKKKNNMKKFKSIEVGDRYSTIRYETTEDDNCPVCEENFVETCNCAYSDKKCKNGHIWYLDREGRKKPGNPHKR